MKYLVPIPELHYSIRVVEADSKEEAFEKACFEDEIRVEYSHTLDDDIDQVEEIEEDKKEAKRKLYYSPEYLKSIRNKR